MAWYFEIYSVQPTRANVVEILVSTCHLRSGESFKSWLPSKPIQAQVGPVLPLGTSTLTRKDNLQDSDNWNTGTTLSPVKAL